MSAAPHADLRIRVQPRASRNEVAGEREGRILIRVTAPPAEGRANEAVVAVLAKRLRVPKSRVTIVSGQSTRDKHIEIGGLTTSEAIKRLHS